MCFRSVGSLVLRPGAREMRSVGLDFRTVLYALGSHPPLYEQQIEVITGKHSKGLYH